MSQPFEFIDRSLAKRIKLIVTDVDGTITDGYDSISPEIQPLVKKLNSTGITFGLASGRTLPRLDLVARIIQSDGPVIAENGAVVRMKPDGELLNLGYSREPAMKTFEQLKKVFPGAIEERQDNQDRTVEVSIWAHGLNVRELSRHLPPDMVIHDTGYMLHITQKNISKGSTLLNILNRINGNIKPEEVLVFGDSLSDISFFKLFPNNVLIPNPLIQTDDKKFLETIARFHSRMETSEGFCQVIRHVFNLS